MKKAASSILILSLLFCLLLAGCAKDGASSQGVTEPPAGSSTSSSSKTPAYPLRSKGDIEAKRGVYYEIFVRSFADSDGDGVGDFNGVTAKLDYLKDLGIDGIWLMPVNESDSYHGYDVTDYYTVNSDYGTEEDFKNMLTQAHERGIKVIMDFVVNHTSNQHPWFVSSKDKDSKYRDYYTWVSKDDPDYDSSDRSAWGSQVWNKAGDSYYYGMFSSGMPDLNYDNKEVRSEIKAAAKKWLEFGIDGFRLDAAMHIYGDNENKHIDSQLDKNLEWWNDFAVACEEVNPDVYLVGEAWQGSEALAEYAQPFDTKFDFAFEETLMQAVKSESTLYSTSQTLAQFLQEVQQQHYAADSKYIDGVFGTNHDQNRIMSQTFSEEQARLVANIYLTLDGNPYIYYGEEIGMQGEKPDERIREPFKWTEDGSGMDTSWEDMLSNETTPALSTQQDDKDSMYHYYKKLIAVRKGSDALSKGKFQALDTGSDSAMAYSRISDKQTVYAVHNFTDDTITVKLSELSGTKLLFAGGKDVKLDGDTVTLGAYASILAEK